MMDAPDSPPEMPSASIGNLITTLSSGSSKDTSPMTMAPPASKASGETKVSFGAPGSSWNTKKFSEEYERAEATLLDKNWNASMPSNDG